VAKEVDGDIVGHFDINCLPLGMANPVQPMKKRQARHCCRDWRCTAIDEAYLAFFTPAALTTVSPSTVMSILDLPDLALANISVLTLSPTL